MRRSRRRAAAGRAAAVIDEIVVSVQQVNQLISEIAVASAEQSAGVGEVNKAILQLESVTQQNAALVEQAAASSLTFQEQADRLRDLVAPFRIQDETPIVPPRQAAAAPKPKPRAEPLPRPGPRPLPKKKMAPAVGADDEWKEF